MGLFPYISPEEMEMWDTFREIETKFLKDLGYVPCYTVNEKGYMVYDEVLLAPNGKTYTNREDLWNELRWYPGVKDKDGVCWNEYHAREKEGFIDPHYDLWLFSSIKGIGVVVV